MPTYSKWVNVLAAAAFGGALLAYHRSTPGFSFAGKVVLITGGSRGLGLVMGRMLAEEGARLAICGRDEEALEVAQRDLERRGAGEVLALPCDVTHNDQVRAFVQLVKNHFGHIDVLINNAGMIQVGPLEAMNLGDFQQALNTNFYGALHTTLAVLPGMLQRGEGRIVNIASVAGLVAAPHMAPYSVSKFALTALSESLRIELGERGIVTTLVCPGEIRTGAHQSSVFKGKVEEEYGWFTTFDVMDPPASSPETVARVALEACRQGRALQVIGLSAKIQALAHHLSPSFSLWLTSLFETHQMPKPGGDEEGVLGREINPSKVAATIQEKGDAAARRYNQPGT